MMIHNLRPGPASGAEYSAERLAINLVKLGYSVEILTPRPFPEAAAEEDWMGVKIHRVPYRMPYFVWWNGLKTFRYLVKRRREYDIIHCHQAFGHAMVGVIVARLLGKKCIVKTALTGQWGDFATLRTFDGHDEAFQIIKQADVFVCISHALERELPDIGIDPAKIVYIPNGVDPDQFKPLAPRRFGAPAAFLQVCRMHPQKGVDVTLRAAQLLKQRGYDGRFRIEFYGERFPEYDYTALAHELNVEDAVCFAEYTRNIYPLYVASDVFLLPSRAEGLSNSLLEAMSMEMPVIATRVSGSEDVLTDGVDGRLIEADQPAALADAMQQYLDRPKWALQLGQEARRTIQARFSIEFVAEQYARLYDRLSGKAEG